MSRSTFQRIWNDICLYVSVMKPATDLCFDCQQNSTLVMRSANLTEEIKSERLENAQKHLALAQLQRHHYNDQCELAKKSLESTDTTPTCMHYSFDCAQQIHFPYSPQQPGQLFFQTLRKWAFFGVCCEATSSQVNYLIDEADNAGKGANAIVSLVHDYLGKNEKGLMLHADNCVGQNKNNTFMQYITWRILTKRNDTVQLSFMLVGHTKFAPDRFFGLFKRQFWSATVDTMYNVVRVMKESSVAGKNIPMPTVDFSGKRNLEWYDWSSLLGQYFCTIPNITTSLFKKKHQVNCVQRIRWFTRSAGWATVCPVTNDLPQVVTPKGLDAHTVAPIRAGSPILPFKLGQGHNLSKASCT